VTTRATSTEHVAPNYQDRVGQAVRARGNFRRRTGTRNSSQHDRQDGREAPKGAGPHRSDDTDLMGMDPTRPHKRRPTDILFVGAGILVAVLLVLWALFG
jgi:hypothetical protein